MSDEAPATRLDALRAILVTAHEWPPGSRVIPSSSASCRPSRSFRPDREPVLKIIERDATWCRIVEQTSDETGITVRPNPHASLYVHVFGQVDTPSGPLQRDVDVIGFGIERFLQMMPLFFQEGVHEQWTASARALAQEADPELL
jgi:hypothetical protein